MATDVVKIRVRSGSSEVEIESELSHIREAVELIPEIIAKFPAEVRQPATQPRASPSLREAQASLGRGPDAERTGPSSLPSIMIEKGDSLGDVVSKFFRDSWGRNPRDLNEVREALQSYGLSYPKQSVAVALLRLAKSSKIRRFKGEAGEYVYTASGAVTMLPEAPQEAAAEPPPEA